MILQSDLKGFLLPDLALYLEFLVVNAEVFYWFFWVQDRDLHGKLFSIRS